MPQQAQTGYNNNGNNGNVYGNNSFGQQPQQQQQQQVQPQHTGYAPNANMGAGVSMINTTGSMPPPHTAQQPQLQSMQPQGTGYYQPANAANAHPAQPSQSQGTGYYVSTPNLVSSNQAQQPLQAQVTGYFQSQPQQAPPPPQRTQPLQPLKPQQTGFYVQPQNQTPLEPLKPTATGFVNSFANNGLNNDIKIPAMRLSFITAQDQAKFRDFVQIKLSPTVPILFLALTVEKF